MKQHSTAKPSITIWESPKKEKLNDYYSNWHNESGLIVEGGDKTVKPKNGSEDQENQYPLYFQGCN